MLQDYLEALAESSEASSPQDAKLLFGYAEMKYRMAGGGKCPLCRTHVRHVVPVFAKHPGGEEVTYECLCQRCLQGEIGLAEQVELRIGDACVRYTRSEKGDAPTRTFVPPHRKAAAAD